MLLILVDLYGKYYLIFFLVPYLYYHLFVLACTMPGSLLPLQYGIINAQPPLPRSNGASCTSRNLNQQRRVKTKPTTLQTKHDLPLVSVNSSRLTNKKTSKFGTCKRAGGSPRTRSVSKTSTRALRSTNYIAYLLHVPTRASSLHSP